MEFKILFVLISSCGLSKKLKSPRVKAIWECHATTQSEAKNWCAPLFCEKITQSVDPLWQCETKNCGNGWNAVLSQTQILYFVAFVPSYLLFLGMFLIECFLYESNTTCTSSYRSYFYSVMYTGKSRYENDFAFHQCRSKIQLLVLAQDTDVLVFLIRRYSQLPCLSFFVQASGEHV